MRHRGIDCDDEIERSDQRGGIGEVGDLGIDGADRRQRREGGAVAGSQVLVQADEVGAAGADLGELREWHGARVAGLGAADRPGDADARAGARPQDPGPARGAVRLGAQVRGVGGDGRQRGAEGERQAEERRLRVARRQLVAARNHTVSADEQAHQGDELGLHLEHDVPAEVGDGVGVAAELDGVAEALLGVEEHSAAVGRRARELGGRDPGGV